MLKSHRNRDNLFHCRGIIASGLVALALLIGFHPTHVSAQNIIKLRQAAERGDVRAQYVLGVLYDYGYDVQKNDLEAAKWFRRAADRGHPLAQLTWTLLYTESGQAPTPRPSAAMESRIDGSFDGWDGETIVKLVNGQIWQQDEDYYHDRYAYWPKVIVSRTIGGYVMHVDGVPKAVRVTRLK